jgi:FSR family fosmidomycin resistance protein-like MFS transporter
MRDGSGRRVFLFWTCLAVIPLFSYFLLFPLASDVIRKQLQFSYTEIGVLIAVVNLFFAIGGLPGGWLVDHWSAKRVAVLGLLTPIVSSAIVSFSSSFPAFLLAQMLIGISFGLYWTASIALLSTCYPRHMLSTAIGIFNAAVGGGLFAASSLAPRFISQVGWRSTYLFATVPLFLATITFAIFARPLHDTASDTDSTALQTKPVKLGTIALICLLGMGFIGQGQYITVLTLQVPYSLSRHISFIESGQVASIGMVAIVIATLLGGRFAEKRRTPIQIFRWCLLLSIMTVLLGQTKSPRELTGVFLLTIWPIMFGLPAYYSVVPRIASAGNLGHYSGLLTLSTTLGATVYSLISGLVLNHFGTLLGYRLVFWCTGLTALAGMLLTFYPSLRGIDRCRRVAVVTNT